MAVDRRLAELQLSRSEFARRVGMQQPAISMILSGRRQLTRHRVAKWTAALQLDSAGQTELRRLWLLGQCPVEIQDWVRQLQQSQQRHESTKP